MEKPTEQTRGAPANVRPRTREPRPIDYLQQLGVVEREAVARWLDAMQEGHERELLQISQLAMQGHTSHTLSGQAAYSRVKISVLKELAWIVRTAKGGPLSGHGRKRKSPDSAS